MNQKRYQEVIENRLNRIRETLLAKGNEYSNPENRLIAFEKAGAKKGVSREQALDFMRLKHEVSVDDIREKVAQNGYVPSPHAIDEKIGDIINYYILEEACYIDRLDKEIEANQADKHYKIVDYSMEGAEEDV